MKIQLNGEFVEIEDGLSVSDLIRKKNLDPDGIVVELNLDIIKKINREQTILKDKDVVEILHFVGGG